jgi:hypothetical protein
VRHSEPVGERRQPARTGVRHAPKAFE